MSSNLQTLANLATVIALPIAIIAVLLQLASYLYPNPNTTHPLSFIRRLRVVFPYLAVAGLFFWFGTRNSVTQVPGIPVAIDSTPGWHPTGFTVNDGDRVRIEVVAGKWTVYRFPFPAEYLERLTEEQRKKVGNEIFVNWFRETDGSGLGTCDANDNCPIPGQKIGGLVALIGDTKYFIGNKCIFNATETGQIFLQINDQPSEPTGNFGVLAVQLEYGNKNTDIVSSFCGQPSS